MALLIPLSIVVNRVSSRRFIQCRLVVKVTTNESDRLQAVNCGPKRIIAQGISTHGPIDTSFNCS